MAFYCIKTEQRLPISLNEAWEFFSSPKNLNEITPKDMGFVITNNPSKEMYAGQIITYKVSPIAGIKMDWMTEITQVVDKKHFIDEQRFGPYALWHHQHHFEAIEGGVLMRDEVNYKLPFGFLGTIAHTLFVKNKLRQIFDYRFKVLEERFGKL